MTDTPFQSDAVSAEAAPPANQGLLGMPRLLFEEHYVWFVFLSTLDILLTWVVLNLGGVEINYVANAVIQHHNLTGLVGFKFGLVVLIVILIDTIGRLRRDTGLMVARLAVGLTSVPVLAAVLQLGLVAVGWWIMH